MNNIERIVLIDDNELDNEYQEIIIRRAGFTGEVVMLEDGVAALRYFGEADTSRRTLVFLDINMPMMNGFEVALAATPMVAAWPSIVFLMLTSSAAISDKQKAAEIGLIKGFMSKPWTKEAMKTLLNGALPGMGDASRTAPT